MTRLRISTPLAALMTIGIACGNAPPPAAPAAAPSAAPSVADSARTPEPPEGPVPSLRSGAFATIDVPGVVDLAVQGRTVKDGYEIVLANGPPDFDGVPIVVPDTTAGQPAPRAFGSWIPSDKGRAEHVGLWMRRPVSDGPITGDLYFRAREETGKHVRFRIADLSRAKDDPALRAAWLRALATYVAWDRTGWSAFASTRLRALADVIDPPKKAKEKGTKRKGLPPAQIRPPSPPAHDELSELMDTTTGATAVQEALQTRRTLFLEAAAEKATIPIATLKPPPLAQHPWKTMSAKLGTPPGEPLAANAPADFYFARATGIPSLFHLLDQVDDWGTPAAIVLDHHSEQRDIAARYETQLGLARGPLTRALGAAVVGEVGVVGSDPYVREGSDVTMLFQVKNRTLFDASLAATLGAAERAHGLLARETRNHDGVAVAVARSADGAVAQQRATIGDLELVSNSPAAIDAVIDVAHGHHPRLADEPDFQFMLARDAGAKADVLAFMSDRFVAEVIGPKQKVLEARREIALGELMGPGFAALLYGMMQGKLPAKVEDLYAAGIFTKAELTHTSGAAIAWEPGKGARSVFGAPAALTPLIDLPAPQMVTRSEQAGYARFARAYEERWSRYVDPAALRIAFDDAAKTMTADLRELPLIDETDYHRVADFVGDARFASRPLETGFRVAFGIGAQSDVRDDMSRTLRAFSSREHELKLDWIGDWAAFGLEDRTVLAEILDEIDDKIPQLPSAREDRGRRDSVARVVELPAYLEVGVKSVAQVALMLTALRVVANETIPDMFSWGEAGKYRGVAIVQVSLKKELTHDFVGSAPEVNLFYAVTDGALIVTLQRAVIERRIDEQLNGAGTSSRAVTSPSDAAQLAVDLGAVEGKGLWTCLAWLLEENVLRASSSASDTLANILFSGAPELASNPEKERALALTTFGAVPLTPDGAPYAFAREGAADPVRGTDFAPKVPNLPVPGSPVAKVLAALARVRSQIAFDDEGKNDKGEAMRSLHARATFGLR